MANIEHSVSYTICVLHIIFTVAPDSEVQQLCLVHYMITNGAFIVTCYQVNNYSH